MKRTIAAGLVLLLLLCMATASAGAPGSAGDSLMILSDLYENFDPLLKADISETLGDASDKALNRLDEVYKSYLGYSFAPRFAGVSLAPGETITLSAGGSFILLSGAAALTLAAGSVINVSVGDAVSSGEHLVLNQRYFCTEDTTAILTASLASTGRVDGYYLLSGNESARPSLPFVDVSESDWFFAAVGFVYEDGLFMGTAADTFSPAATMTRAMFVTVLYRLDGGDGPQTEIHDSRFGDIASGMWYTDAVAWGDANGIVTGYDDETFRPDAPVTREQMSVIMHRYAEYKEQGSSQPDDAFDAFPDKNEVSAYAVAAMKWAVSRGIINGSNGSLFPRRSATRAQVAQIIFNYCMI
ncbi:MAG: S-layer homology domain-containing protein [Oscillospiraceae bacterium]|nr:S-layer homology domain-containing protein [Oscillospiraceae bacterium]